ncbi:MAG: 6-bladed beta-propeller [Candidatus Korobacteraceae bacterium]
MRHKQQACSMLLFTASRTMMAVLTIATVFTLTVGLAQSPQAQNSYARVESKPSHTQNSSQAARVFPRLSLGTGREVVYVGVFLPDAIFRGTSKFSRFLDAMNVPRPDAGPPVGSSEQAARQSGVPPWMLSCNQRVVDDIEPPAHAIALAEGHSPAGNIRDAVVSFVYGPSRVLRTPQRLTTDSRQRVILSDPGIPAVHVLDPKRKTSFSILGGQGRRLQSPTGVAVDGEDNIYVADAKRGMVLVYDRYGKFVRYIGSFHGENIYQRPTGIAIDRKAGHLYLADGPRHLIFVLDLEGNLLKRVGKKSDDTGSGGLKRRNNPGLEGFNYPTEIAVSDREVAVLDTAGTRVQIMDLECNLLGSFSVLNASYPEADREDGLGLDNEGNVYVSDAGTSEVRMYNEEGRLVASFGQAGSRMGEFSAPKGLWIDASNRLYVADTENARVQLFQLTLGNRSDWSVGSGK